jgi:hypothetical protein
MRVPTLRDAQKRLNGPEALGAEFAPGRGWLREAKLLEPNRRTASLLLHPRCGKHPRIRLFGISDHAFLVNLRSGEAEV